MKVIIAGSRDITPFVTGVVNASGFDVTEVVSGGATGVDESAEEWADLYRIPMTHFPADWNTHGRAAGPVRNRRMAEYADALILIWDGESKGSASMKREALRVGLPIHEVILSREKH